MKRSPSAGELSAGSVSKYRREIMGAAILGIVVFHGRAVWTGGIAGYLFAGAKLFMQIGVDLFFLLSGFGCFHSLRKNSSVTVPLDASRIFYAKRLRRILPKYLLVAVLDCVINLIVFGKLVWQQIIQNYSLITFFSSGVLTEWFIASILVLYLITPPLFQLMNADGKLFCGLIGFAAAAAFCISLCRTSYALMIVNEIFFTRIPVFMSGLLLGKKCEEGMPPVCRRTVLLICAVFLAAYLVNRLMNSVNEIAVERLLFCPLAIAITFLLGSVFESFPRACRKVFTFLGGITLELYLVHEKLLGVFQHLLTPNSQAFVPMLAVDAVSFFAAIGFAVLIHRLFLPLEK